MGEFLKRTVAGMTLVTAAACGGSGGSHERETNTPGVEHELTAESLASRPTMVGKPACHFAVAGERIVPKKGLNAPAVWVYPGMVDAGGTRVDRPIVTMGKNGKETYYRLDANRTPVKLGKIATWIAAPNVVQSSWVDRPTSQACDTGEALPPHGDAVTLEGGKIKYRKTTTLTSFLVGNYTATTQGEAHKWGAVGAQVGKAGTPFPAGMVGSTTP